MQQRGDPLNSEHTALTSSCCKIHILLEIQENSMTSGKVLSVSCSSNNCGMRSNQSESSSIYLHHQGGDRWVELHCPTTLRNLSDMSSVRGTGSQQEEHRGDSQWRSFLSCTQWIHRFDVVMLAVVGIYPQQRYALWAPKQVLGY